jgi:hypothetical protein
MTSSRLNATEYWATVEELAAGAADRYRVFEGRLAEARFFLRPVVAYCCAKTFLLNGTRQLAWLRR